MSVSHPNDILVRCCRCRHKHRESERKRVGPDKHGWSTLVCPRCNAYTFYEIHEQKGV